MRGLTPALRLALLLAGLGLIAGCDAPAGSDGSVASPSAGQRPASSTGAAPAVVVDGPVAVTPDRNLLVRCYGQGSPTIVLEGGSPDLTSWSSSFVQTLAETTTTCAYSRANGFGSSPVKGPVTRKVIVHDAFALLEELQQRYGVSGPYLFVGWSFGGSVILAEALEHPELIAGLVVLDSNFPVDYVKVCTASGRTERACQRHYDEDEEAKSIETDIAHRVHRLPDIPIAEVSAMQLNGDCAPAPGGDSVSYEAAGVVLTAPDCEALARKIAENNLSNWRQLGEQVREYRVQATHDALISEAGPEIVGIIRDILGAK